MPFSLYLKPEQQRYALGNQVVDRLPSIFQIPRTGLDIAEGLNIMRDVNKVADLAGSTSAVIPDMSTETLEFIDDYTRSDLARFHEEFYSDEHDPPESWPNTYDKTPMITLPLCIQKTLTEPNDMLMKPAAIQLVVRALLAIGWRPRHVAGLIRSKYERDYGWGERWYRHDASTRADFYTRMFAGLLHTGLDELIDFNCVSTQENGYCRVENCGNSLTPLYDILIG
jgi:hypothetical protein